MPDIRKRTKPNPCRCNWKRSNICSTKSTRPYIRADCVRRHPDPHARAISRKRSPTPAESKRLDCRRTEPRRCSRRGLTIRRGTRDDNRRCTRAVEPRNRHVRSTMASPSGALNPIVADNAEASIVCVRQSMDIRRSTTTIPSSNSGSTSAHF